MNSSLRDQLLAAGLVTEKQARKAAQEEQQRHFRKHSPPPQARPQQGRSQPPPPPPPKVQAEQAQATKVARDKELNRRREDKAQRKARLAEIEQLVEQNRLPRLETEDFYSFPDGKKIRRMSVDPQRREQLTKGELVVVRYKGFYAVVPAPIADRIRERDPNMVVPVAKPPTGGEVEDAYKEFVVPDDLMW
jgi:uncharacterized protein YaiL (DUF2058 family)